MATCVAEPDFIELCRRRGDSFADEFTIREPQTEAQALAGTPGTPIDITGFSFILTVDPESDPLTSANNLFALTGNITDATGGVVEFAPSTVQSDQTPDVYFYDIQQTDGGAAIRTIAVGPYEITQDITKT